MSFQIADQYTLLHFAVGVVAYFWKIEFWTATILHTIFELIENTPLGIKFINKYFPKDGLFRWPGGKNKPDSLINTIGDTISFAFGHLLAQFLDELSHKRGWYNKLNNNTIGFLNHKM